MTLTGPPVPIGIPGPRGPIPALLAGNPAGSRATLILGHGLSGTMRSHWEEAQRLQAAGFAALLAEAPHHGLRADGYLERMAAAPPREARALFLDLVEEWAAEIRPLADHLASLGAPGIALAGVSMGGHLALAAPHRDRRIKAVLAFSADPVWDDRPGSPHLDPAAWEGVPLLAVTSDDDGTVPPAPMRTFAGLLQDRFGTDHALDLRYPGGHLLARTDWEDAWRRAVAWLDRRFPDRPRESGRPGA